MYMHVTAGGFKLLASTVSVYPAVEGYTTPGVGKPKGSKSPKLKFSIVTSLKYIENLESKEPTWAREQWCADPCTTLFIALARE